MVCLINTLIDWPTDKRVDGWVSRWLSILAILAAAADDQIVFLMVVNAEKEEDNGADDDDGGGNNDHEEDRGPEDGKCREKERCDDQGGEEGSILPSIHVLSQRTASQMNPIPFATLNRQPLQHLLIHSVSQGALNRARGKRLQEASKAAASSTPARWRWEGVVGGVEVGASKHHSSGFVPRVRAHSRYDSNNRYC